MKKKHWLGMLFLAIALFAFSGCGKLLVGIGQLVYIYKNDWRTFYLEEFNLNDEDLLPIEEIKKEESYLFNGCVYNVIELDDSEEKDFNGRFYQWRGAGPFLDFVNVKNEYAKYVGLKAGKIGHYIGGTTPFVTVSIYDENYNFLREVMVPRELPYFGCFYATEDNYYLIHITLACNS